MMIETLEDEFEEALTRIMKVVRDSGNDRDCRMAIATEVLMRFRDIIDDSLRIVGEKPEE